MNDKEKYRTLCCKENSIPLFLKDWWLDAVCGYDNWSVIIIEQNNEIIAAMPLYIRKTYSFTKITMPPFTQNMGPWIKYPENLSYLKKLNLEEKIFNYFIDNLPKHDHFLQCFHYNYQNWLPFYWRGFKQTTRYTYTIDKTSNLDETIKNFSSDKRKQLIENANNIKIVENISIDLFIEIVSMTFHKKNINKQYSNSFIKRLISKIIETKNGKMLFALDKENNIHAVSLIVWDKCSVYPLIGGSNEACKNSVAKVFIYKHAIEFANENNLNFDFEGSMLKGVEYFFRSFGATQKSYFLISKYNSKTLKTIDFIRSQLK